MKRISPLVTKEAPIIKLGYAPDPWKLVKCCETGIVFLENPPGYDSLVEEYSFDKTWQELDDKKKSSNPLRYYISKLFKNVRSSILKRDKTQRITRCEILKRKSHDRLTILDIGCGSGEKLNFIKSMPDEIQKKCQISGIDISISQIAKANELNNGGYWVQNNAVDGLLEFQDEQVDIMVLNSFLEHELHPISLLKNARAKLKKGGVIIIKVPNFNCWNRLIFGYKWCGFRHPDHVNYFTPKTLKASIAMAGFENYKMGFNDAYPWSDSMYMIAYK